MSYPRLEHLRIDHGLTDATVVVMLGGTDESDIHTFLEGIHNAEHDEMERDDHAPGGEDG